MAQPSTSSPSRPQPLALDSSLAKSHSLLDQGQGQEQQSQSFPSQPQPPHRLQEETRSLFLERAPHPPCTAPAPLDRNDDASTVGQNHTHSFNDDGASVRQGSSGGDGDGAVTGTNAHSSAAYVHTNSQPATTSSADLPVDTNTDNGQNGTLYNGDRPLSTSPLMSNPQPPPGPPRQSVSYPSPTSYPPAGMPSAAQYTTYSQQTVPPPDSYRPNPTALPSMRTLDHVQSHQQHQQHQHQHQPQHQHAMPLGPHMGAQMATATTPMGYYNVPPHAYGMHPDPTVGMRFAITPGLPLDPRIALSGGRHKKEIKRRTKTGCLTCRKRRIKCDETHPTCNNCKKSKRECLGYDPIFKQQHGPTAIQPAPNSHQSPTISATTTLASTPTVPSSASRLPYQPTVVPSSYPAPLPSNVAFDSPVTSTPQSTKTDTGFDYSTAIDPALQGADSPSAAGTPSPQYPHLKNEGPDRKSGSQGHQLRAKKMKVDELIALGGPTPPAPSSPPPDTTVDEITKLYYEIYVPGLTMFFESQWYNLQKGQPGPTNPNPLLILHKNQPLLNLFKSFLQNIIGIKTTDPAEMAYSSHLETCVVWAFARLPMSSLTGNTFQRPAGFVPAENDVFETYSRLQVFETLLSGDVLQSNPLCPPAHLGNDGGNFPPRRNEFDFWYQLAQLLLQTHASGSLADRSAREHCLSRMRSLLDGRENRDVLYSIAVLREYTAHWDATVNEQTVGSHLEEAEPRHKLAVATRFIRDEATSTGGTTNVVRRFAELAYRAFVRPGNNSKSDRRA